MKSIPINHFDIHCIASRINLLRPVHQPRVQLRHLEAFEGGYSANATGSVEHVLESFTMTILCNTEFSSFVRFSPTIGVSTAPALFTRFSICWHVYLCQEKDAIQHRLLRYKANRIETTTSLRKSIKNSETGIFLWMLTISKEIMLKLR